MTLHVSHLRKQFENQMAVHDLSFDVDSGERVALLGANGAGKTTTLMMILGVTTPDAGEVFIDGVAVASHRAKALENVGFAAAYMTLPRSLTVMESMRIAASTAGLSMRTDRIDEMIERFDISRYVTRLGGELSSGQKTLIGLARAALSKPRLFVLDEPTAYLDPSMSLTMRKKIEDMCNDWGSSLLITSHNMRDIDHLCSRVVFMHKGKLLHDVAPDELLRLVGTADLDEAFIDIANTKEGEPDVVV